MSSVLGALVGSFLLEVDLVNLHAVSVLNVKNIFLAHFALAAAKANHRYIYIYIYVTGSFG